MEAHWPLAWVAERGANPSRVAGGGNRGVAVERDGDGPGNRSDGCAGSLVVGREGKSG